MKLLVTGGAGYIGAHFCKHAAAAGHELTVFDNLLGGYREAVRWGDLIVGDLLDTDALQSALQKKSFDAVVHFASLIAVGESVAKPLRYYRNNVAGSINLLAAMQRAGVARMVFSSTAAVYGNPLALAAIKETHPLVPINPYGRGKHMVEQLLADAAKGDAMRSVCLRYFNAAGADPSGLIGEAHEPETHLIPNAISAAQSGRPLAIFGDDYPTADGSCVRDYVHVNDLASAHLAALSYLDANAGAHAFNLGNGAGFSVLDVIHSVERVCKVKVPRDIAPRRDGDPAMLVADASAAQRVLGWRPQWADIDAIIDSARRWQAAPAYGRVQASV
ncbi:MAG: UDP-glucose 4-epimerase GalE [Pseudomonadota bacterium]|nr:UDP-glucose 4-epimerase GalE [Pseudomonadota bacterium]